MASVKITQAEADRLLKMLKRALISEISLQEIVSRIFLQFICLEVKLIVSSIT